MPKNITPEQQKVLDERKAEADALKISYRKLAKNPAFLDILAKAKLFSEMATKAAVDGVAYDSGGNQIDLSPDKSARLLGESAGLNKLVAYVERQLATNPQKQADPSQRA